jgi:hypothetical protein
MMMSVEQSEEWELAGEIEVLGEKTCPSATLSTTNPTSPDLGSNPGRRGGKPATNRMSYGAAFIDVTSRKWPTVACTRRPSVNLKELSR